MATDASTTKPFDETPVLEFARAFRAAVRAVGFYPATHQSVVAALDKVVAAANIASAKGSLSLSILPGAFLAGGVLIDSTQTVVGELAAILHRHGVGAMSVDGKASVEAWRALFVLLGRTPEEMRAAGGIQRQWKTLRHRSPAILEIDFGALLRGQVGGDFNELAGIISHYLETAGVGASLLDDPCGALKRAVDNAADEPQAVAAILRELRAAAQLTWAAAPAQFDDVFRRAAAIGEHLSAGTMAGLLDQRGSAEATVGTLDIVTALVERMSDTTVSQFVAKAIEPSAAASPRLSEVITTLLPDAVRRRRVLVAAQGVGFEAGVLEKWAELERDLNAYSDSKFVPEQYARKLQSVNTRADSVVQRTPDPPARIAAWLNSIEDDTVNQLDVQFLLDLARVETQPVRTGAVLEILRDHVVEAADAGNWTDAARVAEAIKQVASESDDGLRRTSAAEILQKLAASTATREALAELSHADPPESSDAIIRLLTAIGPGIVPVVVRQWAVESDVSARARAERLVTALGEPGRRALRRVLGVEKDSPPVRVAAIRLLRLTGDSDDASALGTCLADSHPDVRREAFQALATSSTDRARDILASGIAGADAASQMVFVEQVAGLGRQHAVPILARFVLRVDQTAIAPRVYRLVISALRQAGTDEAARALMLVFGRTRWRAPYRALRFRIAAASALRAIGGPWTGAALRALAGFGQPSPVSRTQAQTSKTAVSDRTRTP
ncbi:MAG: HEAT repeat domain-containing protein [Acidobacteria bacterium]|nr:HEAT repeat domain-containing protein [Acidobacteriota bacterium]